jgi:predicted RNase H-like HicB family nuclease
MTDQTKAVDLATELVDDETAQLNADDSVQTDGAATTSDTQTLEFWKAQSRKWERRAKDASTFEADAQAWRQFQADQIPLQERLQAERDAAVAAAEEAKTTMLRLEVAQEFGLTGSAAKLLQGKSREELEANAEEIKALLGSATTSRAPLPDPNQGQPTIQTTGQITDRAQLQGLKPEEILKLRAEGKLDLLLGK